MRATLLVVLTGFTMFVHADPPGYGEVLSQQDRAKPSSGCVAYPEFPRLEIVQEGTGKAEATLAPLITDQKLSAEIQRGGFTSLQVRDLCVKPAEVKQEANIFHLPFIVSVKHTQGEAKITNPDQGTIDVLGDAAIQFDGRNVTVEVTRFYDSQTMERLGRKLGANPDINLDFARAVVKPVLEGYFRQEPIRIQTLINLISSSASGNLRQK